jgi:glycosyltransferase involved in cell wall biosynthesis
MRLLFVHDRFGAMAGAEVNLQLTAAALKARGHTPGLLHGPATGKGEPAWKEIFPERFALANGDSAFQTRVALATFKPDAVYVHKMADHAVLEMLSRSEAPVVRMVHDHDLYCMRSYKYFPLTRRVCTRGAGWNCVFPCGAVLTRNRGGGLPFKWMSYFAKQKEIKLNRRFDRMIVATDYMKRELLRNGFDARRIEMHAPVPAAGDSAATASFSERNLIIYSGQIIRGKGVDVLLESLAVVPEPFECLIFGEGNHRAACEKLCRSLGLADRVYFRGYVPPAELEKHYADASLAVMSSVWPEPFGAAGLEAMRHGLPVVAFDAGGIREWLVNGENGYVVPWMDRAQFARRTGELLRNKTLGRSFGERGRRLLRDKFSFDRYISGLEEMFFRVIHQPVRRETAIVQHGYARA